MIMIMIIIIFIKETFLHTRGFRKGPNISKRTKNVKFIKHLNQKIVNLLFT